MSLMRVVSALSCDILEDTRMLRWDIMMAMPQGDIYLLQ
jgi:hypothetical protein